MRASPRKGREHLRRRSLTRITRVVVLAAATAVAASTLEAEEVVRRVAVMGTWLEVRVEARGGVTAADIAERAVEAVEAAEARLSTWREGTELDRLNRAPVGVWQPLSPALARDLEQARRWAVHSGGAFSATVGSLVAAWGLRGKGRLPSRHELQRALEVSRPDGFELADGRGRRLHAEVAIEEGGFGKGAALADALAATAGAHACVVLDLGGQVALGDGCEPREVAVAHPGDRHAVVAMLQVGPGSVATSGDSVRHYAVGGFGFGHLLDPRSGTPARPRGSATVVAGDPLAADCLATALAVMGESAPRWLAFHPEVDAVLAWPTGGGVRLLATARVAPRLLVTDATFEIDVITGRRDGPSGRGEP